MDTQKIKTFWQRPEGKPGAVVLGIIAIAIIVFFYKHSDEIVNMMQNLYYFLGMLGGLVFIGVLLSDSKFRTTVWYMYKSMMRAFTGIFIQMNPIAILKSYVEDLHAKMRQMDEQIQLLRGQMGKVKQSIQDKKDQMETALSYAKQSKRKAGSDPREDANVKLYEGHK